MKNFNLLKLVLVAIMCLFMLSSCTKSPERSQTQKKSYLINIEVKYYGAGKLNDEAIDKIVNITKERLEITQNAKETERYMKAHYKKFNGRKVKIKIKEEAMDEVIIRQYSILEILFICISGGAVALFMSIALYLLLKK